MEEIICFPEESLISRVVGYTAETFVVLLRIEPSSSGNFNWSSGERNQKVGQILRSLALILDNYWFVLWHSHTTTFHPSSVKLGTSKFFGNLYRKVKIAG